MLKNNTSFFCYVIKTHFFNFVFKGLMLMLDAHSDLFAAGSVDSDYEGFTGLISASHSFPYTAQVRF